MSQDRAPTDQAAAEISRATEDGRRIAAEMQEQKVRISAVLADAETIPDLLRQIRDDQRETLLELRRIVELGRVQASAIEVMATCVKRQAALVPMTQSA